MFDIHAIIERAAIIEFDGGLSRFQAETNAAAEVGKQRWEVFGANSRRDFEQGRHPAEQTQRHTADAMSPMQPYPQEQVGQVLVGLIFAGWGCLEMLALLIPGGSLL